jgi:hybrid polyketide synthase/nonribosomal peptide synthetase ACE1
LRACFFVEPSSQAEPTMGILDTSRFEIVTKTISNPEEADAESKALLSHTWDLEHGLASKVTLFTLNPSKHYLIFGFHHIVIDGFSFNLILNEMNALYEGKQLPPIDLTFSNWASEQRQLVESGSLSQELDFWRSELADLPDPLPLLPMASVDSRQTLTSYHFEESEEITLSTQTLTRIKDLCKRHKVSNFHFFLAIFKIFLFRYLDVEKVCIGLADAGRNDSRTHNTVGYLLNLLPLIFENSPKQKFAEALQEARAKTFSALSNSRVPFTVLLDDLKVPRSTTHNPIYQAFIDYRQINAEAGVLGAKSSGQHSPGRSANDMILDLSAVSNDEIRLSFKVQSTLYSKEAANIMLKSYLQLIDNFTTISDYQIGKLSLSKVPLFNARDIAQAQELARGECQKSTQLSDILTH